MGEGGAGADAGDRLTAAEPATAIIVAFNTPSLDLSWLPDGAPLVIVHNDDQLPDIVREKCLNLRGHGNVGFGAGVNLALPYVRTDRIVIVNPDVDLRREHWRLLADAPSDVIVTPPLVDRFGQPTIVLSPYPSPFRALLTSVEATARLPRLRAWRRRRAATAGSQPLKDAWVSFACVSLPSEPLKAIGGFDERFFLYFEDVDICRRLAADFPGMHAAVLPTTAAAHAVGGSARSAKDQAKVRWARVMSLRIYATSQYGLRWAVIGAIAKRLARSTFGTAGHDATWPDGSHARIAVILSLGRASAMGERRRVAGWRSVLEELGFEVREIALRREHPARFELPIRTAVAILRGTAQPEALSWSFPSLQRRLRALDPRVVVAVSGRAFHPDLEADHRILDYVDRLSVSYRDRAGHSSRAGATAFSLLSLAAARFERKSHRLQVLHVAAGTTDAAALRATFVPVVGSFDQRDTPATRLRTVDVTFIGTLTYPPNVAAVEALAQWWPEVIAVRPGTTLRVAGASPSPTTTALVSAFGWDLLADFEDLRTVLAATTIAVAPLPFASGIQIKVIDAAIAGVPQVVTPSAVQGLPPGAPALVADETHFVEAMIRLLEDEPLRERLAAQGPAWAERHFATASIARTVQDLLSLEGDTPGGRHPAVMLEVGGDGSECVPEQA